MSAIQNAGGLLLVEKDPDDVLDYVLDYSNWLGEDTISTVTPVASGVTVDAALINTGVLTIDDNGFTRTIGIGKAVVVWLSGGVDMTQGFVDLHVQTMGGRKRDWSIKVSTRSSKLRS